MHPCEVSRSGSSKGCWYSLAQGSFASWNSTVREMVGNKGGEETGEGPEEKQKAAKAKWKEIHKMVRGLEHFS